MGKDKYLIVYVGFNGYPEGFASGERQRLISKSLVEEGNRVIILSRKGNNIKNQNHIPYHGIKDGIEYIFTSITAYRYKTFIIRNISKLIGFVGELVFLLHLRLFHRIHFVIFCSRNLKMLKYFSLLSKILGFKIIIDYTELASSWGKKKQRYEKFESLSPLYAHGAFCISTPLIEFIKKLRPGMPLLKLPAICDVRKIEKISPLPDESTYLLFCGTLFYLEIIGFILLSFEKANTGNTCLYLVVNGKNKEKIKLQKLVNINSKKDSIKIFSDISYDHLIGLYKNALALLIPLRDTLQDLYRFPHKIGEYTASARPVITTNYGEIKEYFTDQENALVANEYSIDKFKAKIEYVVNNLEQSSTIGLNGKKTATAFFDYHVIGPNIIKYLDKM